MRSFGEFYYCCVSRDLHSLGKHRQELAIARQGRRLYPDRWQRTFVEIRALIALGQRKKALALINQSSNWLSESNHLAVVWCAGHACIAHGFPDMGQALFHQQDMMLEDLIHTMEQQSAEVPFGYRRILVVSLFCQERFGEARAVASKLSHDNDHDLALLAFRGMLAAQLGDSTEARHISEEIVLAMPDSLFRHRFRIFGWWQAWIAAWMGEKEEAVQLLRDYKCYEYWVDPWVPCRFVYTKPLKGYPPHEQLLATKD